MSFKELFKIVGLVLVLLFVIFTKILLISLGSMILNIEFQLLLFPVLLIRTGILGLNFGYQERN